MSKECIQNWLKVHGESVTQSDAANKSFALIIDVTGSLDKTSARSFDNTGEMLTIQPKSASREGMF